MTLTKNQLTEEIASGLDALGQWLGEAPRRMIFLALLVWIVLAGAAAVVERAIAWVVS